MPEYRIGECVGAAGSLLQTVNYQPNKTNAENRRAEISPNNRAGCKETACKKDNVKITKGELRWGVWVEIKAVERASWHWKHWYVARGGALEHPSAANQPAAQGLCVWRYVR